MKNPADLTHEQLVEIVTRFVRIFYGTEGPGGHWTYVADKQWRGGDVRDEAALLLERFGLVPQVKGGGERMDGQ